MRGVIDQAHYEQMTLSLHVRPHIEDHYTIGEKYNLGGYLFDSLVVKNCSAQELQPMAHAYYDSMKQKFHYAIVSDEELKVMLQGVLTTSSEPYTQTHHALWGAGFVSNIS